MTDHERIARAVVAWRCAGIFRRHTERGPIDLAELDAVRVIEPWLPSADADDLPRIQLHADRISTGLYSRLIDEAHQPTYQPN